MLPASALDQVLLGQVQAQELVLDFREEAGFRNFQSLLSTLWRLVLVVYGLFIRVPEDHFTQSRVPVPGLTGLLQVRIRTAAAF